jgi:hypothetical protein
LFIFQTIIYMVVRYVFFVILLHGVSTLRLQPTSVAIMVMNMN